MHLQLLLIIVAGTSHFIPIHAVRRSVRRRLLTATVNNVVNYKASKNLIVVILLCWQWQAVTICLVCLDNGSMFIYNTNSLSPVDCNEYHCLKTVVCLFRVAVIVVLHSVSLPAGDQGRHLQVRQVRTGKHPSHKAAAVPGPVLNGKLKLLAHFLMVWPSFLWADGVDFWQTTSRLLSTWQCYFPATHSYRSSAFNSM